MTTKKNTQNNVITVLLVDDHPMVQTGLRSCLSYYDDIEVIDTVNDGEYALSKAIELQPDVILMDISMPKLNGIDATEIITEQLENSKVLIFSMHSSLEFVSAALQAGASGYILKDTSSEEVYYAIKAVARGDKHFSSSITQMLIENPVRHDTVKLTTREQLILAHIAKGQSSKEIAKALDISFRTVEAHRRNIKSKLKMDSLAELVRYAMDYGLVDS